MSERAVTRIILQESATSIYYSEQETADYCHVEVQFIRQLSEAGILQGVEVVGEETRYSGKDVVLLRRAYRLHHDLGINLEGVEVILRLQSRIAVLEQEVAQYRKDAIK